MTPVAPAPVADPVRPREPRRTRVGLRPSRAVLSWLLSLGSTASSRWRRSLQGRVVVSTLLVSSVVVALFASLLLDSIGRGLIEAKTRVSLAEARSGVVFLETSIDSNDDVQADQQEARLQDLFSRLSARGATGSAYVVLLVGPEERNAFASPGVATDDAPAELAARLVAGAGPAYVFDDVPVGGRRERGLVVGSLVPVPALGEYRLYHLFPLASERETQNLVRRTVALAGLLLVGLLGLITGLVARQVVAPVRMAARTAERLADGLLDERLPVRGEDELARLGSTFNSMAGALQRQIRQLEDLSRVQQRFVADVSHELRTPLTTVRMAADVLFDSREDYPPSAARAAELLQAELDRFESMLADLLEISRHDAGAAALDPTPTDIGMLVRRVLAAAAPLAERRGSDLDLRLPASPVVAEVEPLRIERVLRNLVVNAIEHGEGRPVEVELSTTEDVVTVCVRDHGVGLQPGQADLVFTRFWRGDRSRARTTGGTGLGLAIALEDVRLHAGWLQAAGSPGKGSVFRMQLPRHPGVELAQTPLALRS